VPELNLGGTSPEAAYHGLGGLIVESNPTDH
jgi:hypothetical protein